MGAPSRAYGPAPKARGSCLSSKIRSGHVLIYLKNRRPLTSLCTCFQGNCPPSSCVSAMPTRGQESGVSNVSACSGSCSVVLSTRSCAGAPGNAPALAHQETLLCWGARKRSCAGASGNAPALGRQETLLCWGSRKLSCAGAPGIAPVLGLQETLLCWGSRKLSCAGAPGIAPALGLQETLLCWGSRNRSCAGAPGNAPVLGRQETLLCRRVRKHLPLCRP